jgi:hypothetical protein
MEFSAEFAERFGGDQVLVSLCAYEFFVASGSQNTDVFPFPPSMVTPSEGKTKYNACPHQRTKPEQGCFIISANLRIEKRVTTKDSSLKEMMGLSKISHCA